MTARSGHWPVVGDTKQKNTLPGSVTPHARDGIWIADKRDNRSIVSQASTAGRSLEPGRSVIEDQAELVRVCVGGADL
jgi:hypothetical protein